MLITRISDRTPLGRRAVACTDPANGHRRIENSLAVVNPQQVLPRSEVAHKAQALRDLKACNDFAFNRFLAIVTSLAE